MKKGLVVVWLMLLIIAVTSLFWYNDWVYKLPTPVPKNYQPVKRGQLITLKGALNNDASLPVFLHFFNPDCPCSRFNVSQFKRLVKQYENKVRFVVVVVSQKAFTQQEIMDKFDLQIPVVFDQSLAASCGVYSTPQAVLLDNQHKLYYRGNYNTTRYCTDEKTNFAKIAISDMLQKNENPVFSQLALKSYGCQLPGCIN